MAAVKYFMTDAETYCLLAKLVADYAARFTPERHSSRRFPAFTTLDEVVAHEEDDYFRTRYYITSPQWGCRPFSIHKMPHPNRNCFWLQPRYGGPYFDHIPSRSYADCSAKWIVPGTFADYPSYYRVKGSDIARPPQMAKAFGSIRRHILKGSVRSRCVERGFTGPHISAGALKFFNSGGWLRVGAWHFEPAS